MNPWQRPVLSLYFARRHIHKQERQGEAESGMLSTSGSVVLDDTPAVPSQGMEMRAIVLFHNSNNGCSAASLHLMASQCRLLPMPALVTLLRQMTTWHGYCVRALPKHCVQQLRRVHRRCRRVVVPWEARNLVVWVPAPSTAWVSFAMTFRSAQLANAEQCRQYNIRCRMALVMTMGGGWASVKNAREALRCSIELYDLAGQLHDMATQRKCRVFVGWALVWHHDGLVAAASGQQQRCRRRVGAGQAAGDDVAVGEGARVGTQWLAKAQHIFTTQMEANDAAHDETNWNRCFAALNHWSHAAAHSDCLPAPDAVAKLSADALMDGDGRDAPGTALEEGGSHGTRGGEGDVLNEWQHLFST